MRLSQVSETKQQLKDKQMQVGKLVGDLRAAIGRASKGKTGRLTTIDELAALTDEQLTPVLVVCNLGLAGELPPCLKLGDVVPL